MRRKFLTAVWQTLVMLNYEIDPAILRPFVPARTELDEWNGRSFVSIVGFMFLDTRVLDIPVPFHRNFEEVNLRFYVRRKGPEGWRRGVVFVKEIVPRWAIATVARVVYNENYVALPMSHQIAPQNEGLTVTYRWQLKGQQHEIHAVTKGEAAFVEAGSEEEFITEHYWGYAAQRDGGTVEYQVEHPSWRVWQVATSRFECDVDTLYGPQFAETLNQTPSSAFVADGSPIIVRQGERI
ncbi:MAG: DUF2071 domain-containing protein [Chloroflexota bacterium]